MITVPAHSFCEPTRAKFTAAARSMPGVWGVLLSSRSLLMTRTPSLRQSRSDFKYLPRPVISGPRPCATSQENNLTHELKHPKFGLQICAARLVGRSAVMDHSRAGYRGSC